MPKSTEVLEAPPVDIEKEELKNRLALLEKHFLNQEQPKNVVNEVQPKLEKPRRILFTINAIQDDDAMHDGAYIPGKAVVSKFKFNDYLQCDVFGNVYTTGFEYDELEYTSGLKGEELQQYIRDVRIARTWIERTERVNLDAGNKELWSQKKFKLDQLGFVYDTDQDNETLITYYNILGGGYTTIGRSYEEAKKYGLRLYIATHEEEEERKYSGRKTYTRAIGILEDIEQDWNRTDALYLMYYLPAVGGKYKGYTVNTPIGRIMNELGDFIEGVDTKTDKKKRPQQFLDAVKTFETDKDLVRTKAIFRAAKYYGFITYYSKDKMLRNKATGFEYGNNDDAAVQILLNPSNLEELSWIKAKVTEKWIS
jgi:hypothetical protein